MKLMIGKCHNNHLQRIYIFQNIHQYQKFIIFETQFLDQKKIFLKMKILFSDFDYIVIDVIF